jgi:hypothetical protein
MSSTQLTHYSFMDSIKEKVKIYSKKILILVATIIIVNFSQWLCIQFLYAYCSKPGVWGMIENILSLGSPICHFVNNIQYNLSIYYVQMWITAGLGIIGILTF